MKPEGSAEVTNIEENSLLVDHEEEKAEETEEVCLHALPENDKPVQPLTDRLEALSICDDFNSAESFTLRRALGHAQNKLLRELYSPRDSITRSKLLEVLGRHREALLSTRDCITARADCLVMNDIPTRKKITKKTRGSRRHPLCGVNRGESGPTPLLPAPIEVDSENDLYFANDYFSEQYEDPNVSGGFFDCDRSLRWGHQAEDELYGMARLETDCFERNIYFSPPETQDFAPEYD
jgi:hypothetical protein